MQNQLGQWHIILSIFIIKLQVSVMMKKKRRCTKMMSLRKKVNRVLKAQTTMMKFKLMFTNYKEVMKEEFSLQLEMSFIMLNASRICLFSNLNGLMKNYSTSIDPIFIMYLIIVINTIYCK